MPPPHKLSNVTTFYCRSNIKHFVTPKAAPTVEGSPDPLNQPYVLFKANGVDATQFDQLFTWEGGKAGTAANKRKVKRDASSRTELKIKTKQGGKVVAQMNVWVTYVDFNGLTQNNSKITGVQLGLDSHRDSIPSPEVGEFIDGYQASASIEWTGSIQPARIITDLDRPALENQARIAPPGENLGVADALNLDASGRAFSGWDVSRRRTIRIETGPELAPVTSTAIEDFPYIKSDYPADPIIGNDDSNVIDEDSDPYHTDKGNKGQIIGYDKPRFFLADLLNSTLSGAGADGDRIHRKLWFTEFARVQIGNKWYCVSDYQPWRFFVFLIRKSGKWELEQGDSLIFDKTNTGLP